MVPLHTYSKVLALAPPSPTVCVLKIAFGSGRGRAVSPWSGLTTLPVSLSNVCIIHTVESHDRPSWCVTVLSRSGGGSDNV